MMQQRSGSGRSAGAGPLRKGCFYGYCDTIYDVTLSDLYASALSVRY